MITTPKFLNWLHDLTILGYDKKVRIPNELMNVVENLFKDKVKPNDAIDFLIRHHSKLLKSDN